MAHTEQHPDAGKEFTLNFETPDFPAGSTFVLEDWWDHLTGGSWMLAQGNPAAIRYAIRSGATGLPLDDEVVYGKVGPFGHLIHASELSREEVTA